MWRSSVRHPPTTPHARPLPQRRPAPATRSGEPTSPLAALGSALVLASVGALACAKVPATRPAAPLTRADAAHEMHDPDEGPEPRGQVRGHSMRSDDDMETSSDLDHDK